VELRIASVSEAIEEQGEKRKSTHHRVSVEAIRFGTVEQTGTFQWQGPRIIRREIEQSIVIQGIDSRNLHKLQVWWGSPRHLYILHPDGELYSWQPKA
jgi:hypothetical protein